MNKNMITLDHRNSKITFSLHSTSKSAFIFPMLYSYSWLVLCTVYTKILNKNTYTDKLRDIAFNQMRFICDYEHDIVSDLRLNVLHPWWAEVICLKRIIKSYQPQTYHLNNLKWIAAKVAFAVQLVPSSPQVTWVWGPWGKLCERNMSS